MTNFDQPAFPDTRHAASQSFGNQNPDELPTGLSKLEYASIQLASGMCQGVWEDGLGDKQAKMIAESSVYLAKLVLALSSK